MKPSVKEINIGLAQGNEGLELLINANKQLKKTDSIIAASESKSLELQKALKASEQSVKIQAAQIGNLNVLNNSQNQNIISLNKQIVKLQKAKKKRWVWFAVGVVAGGYLSYKIL